MDFNPGVLQNLLINGFREKHDDEFKQKAQESMLNSLFKKWVPEDTKILESVAIDGFKSSNARCAVFDINSMTTKQRMIAETVKFMLHDMFFSGPLQTCVLTLDTCLAKGRAGPGASRSTKHTDFFNKMFFGRLSATSTLLYYHYRNGISHRWLEAELLRSKLYQVDIVEGSSLSTVPKNAKTNRTICTEPSLNMFYQLGVGEVINDLLKKYHNIDMSLQPEINASMAKVGSINGSFATIDLTSASDTISVNLLHELLPERVLKTLMFLRSPVTAYKEEVIELAMISSMGNGFTFPLQTLLFSTLVKACYLYADISPRKGNYRNYSVFGDDIICLGTAYDLVIEMLGAFGFSVNSEKSYGTGPFRESCGHDYYKGYDIRGVYLKEIKNEQDVYSAFNRICRWSAKHNIDCSAALNYLKGLAEFRPVPYDSGDAEGIKCPRRFLPPTIRTDRNGALYYRATVTAPNIIRVNPAKLDYNFHAGIISSIGGFIRGYSISPRVTRPKLKVVKRRTPSWDFVPDAGLTIQDYQLIWEYLS